MRMVAGMAAGAALKGSVRPAFAVAPVERPERDGLQDLRLVAGGHTADVLRVNDGDTFEARVHIWPGMQVTT